ncbi:MAG: helix-turn-helix transcriptional regulator [Clostridia bacterium]|nr:helix-turn-helix transcriptional regulator [Clostridia bacterium]
MINLSKFSQTLTSLMMERNLNAPALANILKTDRSNITRYMRGERLPLFHGFVALIEYFNVSADVLLGLIDYTNDKEFLPIENFGERLKQVMLETKTTQYAIEKYTDISSSSVYNWLYANRVPTVESLVKLSEFMGVSVDYLLGRVK